MITTYAAVELYRYGGLTAGLRDAIAEGQDRQADLAALMQGVDALSRAGAALSHDPSASGRAAFLAEQASLDRAAARLQGWAALDPTQKLTRDTLLPLIDRWESDLTRATQVTAPARADASRAVLDGQTRIAELTRDMAAFETREVARFLRLWGDASREVSGVLSLTLAAIVVLVASVILRSLAYLSWRDRTEARLRRATEAANTANAAKTDFLATVSHEIRTPLTGIRGYADLLLSANPRKDQRRHLERLREAGETLGALIDDILDLSRIEAGRIETTAAPFDLPALCDRVVALVRPVAEAKGLTLILGATDELPRFVAGDAKRITQVLLNLLNNAVKFTESGSVALSVSRSESGLRFAVTDTGIGIAQADHARLFQRFSQIDGSISRSYGGSGLGLAISKGLVEAMGGRIGLESEAGQGSTFWVDLPLPQADAPPAEPDADAPDRVARPSRILVVEDSEQNQDLIRAVLTRAGHSVSIAADGVEGVKAARRGGYDLIVMDMQMPRMDGIAATREIRTLPKGKGDVPILALSANVMPAQVADMRKAGAEAHLGKPFTAAGLVAACAALLPATEAKVVPAPAAAPAPPPAAPLDGVDCDSFDALAGLLGKEWVAGRVQALFDGLGWITDPPPADDLRRRAHRLVSEAGQLGLRDLSNAAASVEESILAGRDSGPAMTILAAESARAAVSRPALLARLSTL